MNDSNEIAILRAENAALRQQVLSLEEKIILLLQRLESQTVKKDSHNSHNPPSQDKSKRSKVAKSLREKSQRKSGGQAGHRGHTLEMVTLADQVEELRSTYCQACGSELPADQSMVCRGQVVDIPPVQPIYTEYRQYGCCCPACDHFQKAAYPAAVNAPDTIWPSGRSVCMVSERLSVCALSAFGLAFPGYVWLTHQ